MKYIVVPIAIFLANLFLSLVLVCCIIFCSITNLIWHFTFTKDTIRMYKGLLSLKITEIFKTKYTSICFYIINGPDDNYYSSFNDVD